jgi:hypothetical protein
LELEVGLLCKEFRCTPDKFGYDTLDPRLMRNFRIAVQVFEAASERRSAKKKAEWDKNNPSGARLLRWARQSSEPVVENSEVKVMLPERPARG